MSIELLDRTRKINSLLSDNRSSKVAFADICRVLGQMMGASVFVISGKGKLLGAYVSETVNEIEGFPKKRGAYLESRMNERFLSVLSTKENVNLETLGFLRDETAGLCALITPISISGERFGTLFIYREEEAFCIDDIILAEYSTTVIGLEMVRSVQEESEQEKNKKKNFSSALTTLTPLEQKAVSCVIHELDGRDGIVVTSKLASRVKITRTVIVNALRKLESAGLVRTHSSGVKGTRIEVLNDILYTEFDSLYHKEMDETEKTL